MRKCYKDCKKYGSKSISILERSNDISSLFNHYLIRATQRFFHLLRHSTASCETSCSSEIFQDLNLLAKIPYINVSKSYTTTQTDKLLRIQTLRTNQWVKTKSVLDQKESNITQDEPVQVDRYNELLNAVSDIKTNNPASPTNTCGIFICNIHSIIN